MVWAQYQCHNGNKISSWASMGCRFITVIIWIEVQFKKRHGFEKIVWPGMNFKEQFQYWFGFRISAKTDMGLGTVLLRIMLWKQACGLQSSLRTHFFIL